MRRPALLAIVVASLLWGTTGTAASFFPRSVSSLAVGSATMGIGGLLLFVFSPRSSSALLGSQVTRGWVLLGAVGVFVYPLAFYTAMNLSGVAVGNVLALGSGPVFAALLEWAFERRRPSRRWLLCTVVAIVGISLLAVFGRVSSIHASPEGVPLGLLAGLAYALYAYCSTRVLATGAAGGATMGAIFGAGAVPLLIVLAFVGAPLLHSGLTIGITAYLVVGPMFVAYLLFAVGLRRSSSSVVTTVTLIEPVVATMLAVVVVGERLTVLGWTGIVLILASVAALSVARLPDEST